jgi:hypothetical protein
MRERFLTTATQRTRRKTKNLFLLLLLAVSPWLMFLNLFFAGIKVSPWLK